MVKDLSFTIIKSIDQWHSFLKLFLCFLQILVCDFLEPMKLSNSFFRWILYLSFFLIIVDSLSDKIEMGLFTTRYLLSLILFVLGLRAPGLPTTRDYLNLNQETSNSSIQVCSEVPRHVHWPLTSTFLPEPKNNNCFCLLLHLFVYFLTCH